MYKKNVTNLLRICCYLPYKYGQIRAPLVTFVKGLGSTR